jgi:hypothetical protein
MLLCVDKFDVLIFVVYARDMFLFGLLLDLCCVLWKKMICI